MARELHERQIEGIRGGMDRHGVAYLSLPLLAKTYLEAFTIGDASLYGLPLVNREWVTNEAGQIIVTLSYSGEVEGNNSSGNEAGAIGAITYGLKPQFGEEPIETHPRLKELMEKYGGYWEGGKPGGRVLFPSELPKGTALAGLGRKQATSQRNPMSGVDKWKPVLVTWTRSYAARQIPGDILSRIGNVITNPPGNPPELPNRTRWLVECPDWDDSDSGNVGRITEIYSLLPEDAPEEQYQASET